MNKSDITLTRIEVLIYYGCKRVPGLNEAKQPKSLDKDWFVYFHYPDKTGKLKRVKDSGGYRNGINRQKTIQGRLFLAQAIRNAWDKKLNLEGFNPFLTIEDVMANPTVDKIPFMFLPEALQYTFDQIKGRWTHETVTERKGTLKYIKEAIVIAKYERMTIKDFRRPHAKMLLNECIKLRNLTISRQRAYKELLRVLFTELMDSDESGAQNPFSRIKTPKLPDSILHMGPTDEELAIISSHLKEVNYRFYVFCKMIKTTLLREKDLLSLKLSNINFTKCEVFVNPENTKNARLNWVAIPEAVIEDLKTICKDVGPDMYIWSRNLKPGHVRIHRNIVTKLWRIEVKLGLGIDRTLYSLKSSGIDAGIEAIRKNVEIELKKIRDQARHTTVSMTQVYDKHNKTEEIFSDIIKQVQTNF